MLGLWSCPDLRYLSLSNVGITALPDAMGELRSLTCLNISYNAIRCIEPSLYGLILQLKYLDVYNTPLKDSFQHFLDEGFGALKEHLRAASSRRASAIDERMC